MRKDIKAKLRQEAASLNVPFTLEETKKRLPDAIEVVEHPKRKRKAAWAIPLLSGSAAVIALSVGLGVGLNRPSTPGGSSSVTLPAAPYSLNEKELSSFGFQALSAVSMYDGSSTSTLARRGRLISQSEAEEIAGEVVEYMDMVSSFANRDGFSFVYDDDSGFAIFFGSQVVYDLDFAETDLGGGNYSYEGTISSADTGVSYRLYGEKEAEVDGDETKEEIEDKNKGKSAEQIEEEQKRREAQTNAQILEMLGDLPDADVKPPENVLFVCQLNPLTEDEDLKMIFYRFGVKSCEVFDWLASEV